MAACGPGVPRCQFCGLVLYGQQHFCQGWADHLNAQRRASGYKGEDQFRYDAETTAVLVPDVIELPPPNGESNGNH